MILPFIFLNVITLSAFEIDEFGAIDTHGYLSQGYLKSDKNNYFCETEEGDYNFYEFGISLTSEVTDNLRMGIQLLSYALGDFGNTDFHVNWANANYYVNKWIGIKAGKIKIYHGLYNRNRDADFLRNNIFLPQSIYNEAWRETISTLNGFELYGFLNAGFLGRFKYHFQTGKVEIEPDGGVAIAAKEKLLEKTNSSVNYVTHDVKEDMGHVYRLQWISNIPGLSINTTYWALDFDMIGDSEIYSGDTKISTVENSVFKTSAQSITGSIKYIFGNLVFISEYSYSQYDFNFTGTNLDLETEGYYFNLIYRLTDWLETGAYWSVYYPDRNNQHGSKSSNTNKPSDFDPIYGAWQKDTCISFRFDITDNWIFKLEGHIFEGTAVMMKIHNAVDYDRTDIDMRKNWLLFGAKITFSF